MACQEYRVGVKIPWPGYLTPHPVLYLGTVHYLSVGRRLESRGGGQVKFNIVNRGGG